MRICFITQTFPDWKGSPRGEFIKGLAHGLGERGYEVEAVAPRVLRGSVGFENMDGLRVYRFPFLSAGTVLHEVRRVPLRMVLFMATGVVVGTFVTLARRCQLIHAHWVVPTGLIGLIVSRLTHRPFVVSAHGTDLLVWGRKPGFPRRLIGVVLKRCLRCTVNSQAMREVAVDCGLPPERAVEVKETGVDVDLFSPANKGEGTRRRYQIPDNALVVLFVAHLTAVKRPRWALRAVAAVRERHPELPLHLLVVGEGRSRAAVEQCRDTLNAQSYVTLAGAVPHEQIAEYFAAADLFLLPSETEGLGIVIMEAMAAGKPVVASRAGGPESIVEEGRTGYLFAPDSFPDLVDKLEHLCLHPGLRQSLGSAGRARAEREFRAHLQLDRVAEMYAQVLTLTGRGRSRHSSNGTPP